MLDLLVTTEPLIFQEDKEDVYSA